jgi:hypothetical protein
MARSYFCDPCDNAMAKGGRVTLNIAVNEPHKAPFPLSFTKELCPLCYENLMVTIAEVMSKPNQVSAARLVQADAGALIDGPGAGGANHDPPAGMSCPGDRLVWCNIPSLIYHFQGERYFGCTKTGKVPMRARCGP